SGLNHLPWYCISRLDTLDKSLLNLMREAGCESMCFGIDSGSKKTLSFIRKSIDQGILLDRVRETTEAGIIPTLSFVIGFPEESPQDLDETLNLALKSAATGNANILVQMATILPGTDLYENYGHRLIREVDTYFSLGIEFDEGKRIASDEALIDSDPAIFCSFYNLPCPAGTLEELNEIASYFTIIASLYPRTFLLLSLELNEPIRDLFFAFLDYFDRTVPIHHRDTERSKIEQEQNLDIALSVSPANPVNPVQDISLRSSATRNASRGERLRLTPQACMASFADFATARLARHGSLVREYIPEVLKYETCLLRAARDESQLSSFHIDL